MRSLEVLHTLKHLKLCQYVHHVGVQGGRGMNIFEKIRDWVLDQTLGRMFEAMEEPRRYLLSEQGTCIKAFGHCKNTGKKCKDTTRDKKYVYCKHYKANGRIWWD